MSRWATQLIATALCAFVACTALVLAREPGHTRGPERTRPAAVGSPRTASAPGKGGPGATQYAVFGGPVTTHDLNRAITFWNSAGADVTLRVSDDVATATIVIGPDQHLPGRIVGQTTMFCAVACRPALQAHIVLSTRRDYPRVLTLVHELGHVLGLAHSPAGYEGCSVMRAVDDRCRGVLPERVPDIDRQALVAVWGRAA